ATRDERAEKAVVLAPAALIESLQRPAPGAQFEGALSADSHTTVYVPRDTVPAIARPLRDEPDLAFTLLADLPAGAFWPTEPRYELVYILVSVARRARLRLKVRLNA